MRLRDSSANAQKVLQRCKSGDGFDEKWPRCELALPTFGGCRAHVLRQCRRFAARRTVSSGSRHALNYGTEAFEFRYAKRADGIETAMTAQDSKFGDTGDKIFVGKGDEQAWLTLALANRHG